MVFHSTMAASTFKIPGEYDYHGMTMSAAFPADVLDKIKELVLNDDDVVIATYPKSGNYMSIY